MGCGGGALGARLSCWEVVGEVVWEVIGDVVWEAGANRNGPRCPHPTRPPTKHPTKHHSAAVGRREYKLQARIERTLPTID